MAVETTSVWPVGTQFSNENHIPSNAKLAAGVLLFFDGKTILLGKEFRKNTDSYSWMEFGGKREGNETPAETAWREGNEETAQTLSIALTLESVKEADRKKEYIEYYNEKSNFFYRMYWIKLNFMPTSDSFVKNALGKKDVEMVEWRYFPYKDVIYNQGGVLPGTNVPLYSTFCIRLQMLKEKEFIRNNV